MIDARISRGKGGYVEPLDEELRQASDRIDVAAEQLYTAIYDYAQLEGSSPPVPDRNRLADRLVPPAGIQSVYVASDATFEEEAFNTPPTLNIELLLIRLPKTTRVAFP